MPTPAARPTPAFFSNDRLDRELSCETFFIFVPPLLKVNASLSLFPGSLWRTHYFSNLQMPDIYIFHAAGKSNKNIPKIYGVIHKA
jgi:hypothetical protein